MFFQDLTSLRQSGAVDESRIKQAEAACKGGHKVKDLTELDAFLKMQFPTLPYFVANLTSSSGFPVKLSAFVISLTGVWNKADQHGVYAVYGNHILTNLAACRDSMTKEKYRDEMAGGLQHLSNGLMHAAKHASLTGMEKIMLPFFDTPKTPIEVSCDAMRAQRMSCTLRSEKYACPGMSKTHYFSYKSSLENLALACEISAQLQNQNDPKVWAVITQLKTKAANLLLANESIMAAVMGDEPLSAESIRILEAEKRAYASTIAIIPSSGDKGEISSTCKKCDTKPSTHSGYICRCKCLCEECASEDVIMECPVCHEYTEFIKR